MLSLYTEFCYYTVTSISGITFVFPFSQNWFAFSKLHKPLFTEHGVISFPNTNPPLDKMNNAYCKVRKEFSAKALACYLQHFFLIIYIADLHD